MLYETRSDRSAMRPYRAFAATFDDRAPVQRFTTVSPRSFADGTDDLLAGPFHSGVNTIDIRVTDFGLVGGLDVTALAITAAPVPSVPEPASFVLMLGGFAAFAVYRRKRPN
jgi:hypothetical protein